MKKSFPTKLHFLCPARALLLPLALGAAVSGCVGYYPEYPESQPVYGGGSGAYYGGGYAADPYYYGPTTVYYQTYQPGYYYRSGYGYYYPQPRNGGHYDDHGHGNGNGGDRPRGLAGAGESVTHGGSNGGQNNNNYNNGQGDSRNNSRWGQVQNNGRPFPVQPDQNQRPQDSGGSSGRFSRGPIPSYAGSQRPTAPLAVPPQATQQQRAPEQQPQSPSRGRWGSKAFDKNHD